MATSNTILLVTCICIVVLTVLYLFYANRLVGLVLGLLVRLFFWNQGESSIWLDIGSIHFSLVAGRILVKDLRYHSSNQTIRIVTGQITWRYWIRRPTTEEDLAHARVGGSDAKQSEKALSCRIHVSIQGLEWFIYNKTAAYDAIIAQMDTLSRPPSRVPTRTGTKEAMDSTPPSLLRTLTTGTPRVVHSAMAWFKRQLPNLDPKDLLPLGIEVYKGVVICGNASTPNLLVTEFHRGEGTFGMVQSRSKFDLYKQILGFQFQNAVISFVENEDYRETMLNTGKTVHDKVLSAPIRRSNYLAFPAFAKLWRKLALYAFTNQRNRQPLPRRSRSRKRADDSTPVGVDFSAYEYAIERKILDTPMLELSYYADTVGDVPRTPVPGLEPWMDDVGNGDLPPEWGVDIVIRGGNLRYGPWADRQRAELQRAFFPASYQDVEVTQHLRPGDKRTWTFMKVFIELRDNTTLQIPFKEPSKNWQWDGSVEYPRPKKRDAAWIKINVGDSSTINYIMPMVARENGYEPTLEVHLDSVSINSSLSDIKIVRAESLRIHCELPSPLKWNAERTWTISVALREPILYLTRVHINMFTDLSRDWSTGPPTDYQRFVPMIYVLDVDLHYYALNLYVNDHNVIDKPLVREDNAIVTLRGAAFHIGVQIPSNTFQPEASTIPVSIDLPEVTLALSLPRWNTHALHAPKSGNTLCHVGRLRINTSYRYFADVREGNIEQLKMEIILKDVAYKALGWSIRYIMILRENYLGSFTGFTTMYEYLDRYRRGLPVGDPVRLKYREGQANMMQIEIDLSLDNGVLMLPASLGGFETRPGVDDVDAGECLMLTLPDLQLQLRMHDYFLEMDLNIDTIFGCVEHTCSDAVFFGSAGYRSNKKTFLIDGVDIVANRLFGPQPKTATYICIWDIALGSLKGVLSANEAELVAAAGKSFGLNFVDIANAPSGKFVVHLDPDVTFLKLTVGSTDLTWLAGNTALHLSLSEGLKVDNNDVPGTLYRKITSIRIPQISIKVLITADATNSRSPWLEAADVSTDLYLDIYSSPAGWKEDAKVQEEFVRLHDEPTGRAARMFAGMKKNMPVEGYKTHYEGVYIPQPRLSVPVKRSAPTPQFIAQPVPRPFGWTQEAQVSESEGEEGVSEADRDARLARTRSVTPGLPTPMQGDWDSMSSGDESDDGDITEGVSSDSECSEFENGNTSSLGPYYRVVKQYTSRSLRSPCLWSGSPFTLAKEPRLLGSQPDSVEDGDDNVPLGSLSFTPDDEVGNTIFRVQCQKGLDITVTPLIVSALSRLEEDVALVALTPELYLDAIMVKAMDIPLPKAPAKTSTVVDLRLASAQIRLIQRVQLVQEDNDVSNWAISHMRPDRGGTTTIVDVGVRGLHLMGMLGESSNPNLVAAADGIFGTLDTLRDTRQEVPDLERKPALKTEIKGLRAKVSKEAIHLESKSMLLRIGHTAPEIAAGVAIALEKVSSAMGSIQKSRNERTEAAAHHMIHRILKATAGKSVANLPSSYFVQSGQSHVLRTSAAFRLLLHFREAVWHLQGTPWQDSSVPGDIVFGQVAQLLEDRAKWLAPTVDDPKIVGLFPHVKSSERTNAVEETGPKVFPSVSACFGNMTMLVWDSTDTSPCEFSIASVAIGGRLQTSQLLPVAPDHPGTFSKTSLRESRAQPIHHLVLTISVESAKVAIYSHMMTFVQHTLRVRRHYASAASPTIPSSPPAPGMPSTSAIKVDAVLSVQHFRLQAAAENLTFELNGEGSKAVSAVLLSPQEGRTGLPDHSMNTTVLFNKVALQARSPADPTKRSEQDILASMEFVGGQVNATLHDDPSSNMILRIVPSFKGVHFRVPRSAIRLYRFAEEWEADFLPRIENTLQGLMSEIDQVPVRPTTPKPSLLKKLPTIQLNGMIESLGISLQVMHGTWLSWEAEKIVVHAKSITSAARLATHSFGVQVSSQTFSISSKPTWSHRVISSSSVKLQLPTMAVTGKSEGSRAHIDVFVDFFRLNLKPSHWDTLLVVQQKFGQDFNDLVALAEETRSKRAVPGPVSKPKSKIASSLQFSGSLNMKGFRIGLEGLTSTLYFECDDIGGHIDNADGLLWNIKVTDLALSLAPRTRTGMESMAFNRKHRSAFVIVDFHAEAGKKKKHEAQTVQFTVTKIHAIMQPSSIGQVGDFVDHIQAEMLERREKRATELAAFKEKTKSVMRTIEANKTASREEVSSETSWLKDYIVNLTIKNIGVAFPLTLDEELESTNRGAPVRAFLFSTKSIAFVSHQGESGQATMKGFSFQFVPRFNQSVPADFSGETHATRNRMLYPEMTAQVRSETSATSRQFTIVANIDGFVLDVDPSIVDYIFSLVDVYRQGKERMARVATTMAAEMSMEETLDRSKDVAKQYSGIPTSKVVGSLTFQSGRVRIYNTTLPSHPERRKSYSGAHRDRPEMPENMSSFGADVLRLPVISVWAEYRAQTASAKVGIPGDTPPSILMFKAAVHSSENTLRPSLLPFIAEIISQVEVRMRQATSFPEATKIAVGPNPVLPVSDEGSRMEMSFSLRIDQSKLELTCQPDVNVVAGLEWESGGFVVNVSPGARKLTFTGTVGGLNVGLKHGFLSEDCVKADARNLAFSMTFSKGESETGQAASSISVVVDTEFSGIVRFSRLQDVLCFKAVWLDRIPVFAASGSTLDSPTQILVELPTQPVPPKQTFSTSFLVRIRKIHLEVDLGQSISTVTLNLHDALMRTNITDVLNEVSVSVADVTLVAKGNMAGSLDVSNAMFQTVRRTERNEGSGKQRMLELSMTSGALNASLESDHQQLLYYRAEPLEVQIYDDWSSIDIGAALGERPLHLSFVVSGSELVVIATVGTIPKLLSYANRFTANLDAQREGAARESQTFRTTRAPKPDNPLSSVAEAMIHSARTRYKEAESGLSYVIRQHLSLRLDHLKLVVFPRTMKDPEMAQFVGTDVLAKLNRLVESVDLPDSRDLRLAFSSMTISKFGQLNHAAPVLPSSHDSNAWLQALLKNATEAIIVGLPTMNMHMISEESSSELGRVVSYDFNSKFVRRDGMQNQEDIYITLNISLYSWLTVLRKNLTREMDQVQSMADTKSAAVGGMVKKKPEPLQLLADIPKRASTMLSPSSASSPTVALFRSSPLSHTASPAPSMSKSNSGPGSVPVSGVSTPAVGKGIVYKPRDRQIERLTMRQLGEATPDVMHPFFMKKAGFSLEDSLPQYVNEYAAGPLQEIMDALLKIYSKQLQLAIGSDLDS